VKNEIFVCKARVVFGQDVVFFRTLSKNTKNRRGSGGGRRGKKDVLFFEPQRFVRQISEKKVHFLQFRGFLAGVWAYLDTMLDSANLTFLWS
jgi:hypothetical protein